MEKVEVKTKRRIELIDITKTVQSVVAGQAVEDGVCFVFCPHTTAGLTLNENADPAVKQDISATLETIIPERGDYRHTEGNADSHIKSSLFGSGLTIFIVGGKLALGTWQGIYLCESDGPRARQVWINCM